MGPELLPLRGAPWTAWRMVGYEEGFCAACVCHHEEAVEGGPGDV